MTEPLRNPEQFTPFKRWFNELGQHGGPLSAPKYHFSMLDIDFCNFKYTTDGRFRFLFLEAKGGGQSNLSASQQMFIPMFDLICRALHGKTIAGHIIDYWGYHTLVMSGHRPDKSDRMTWNGKPIAYEQLLRVLRFEDKACEYRWAA